MDIANTTDSSRSHQLPARLCEALLVVCLIFIGIQFSLAAAPRINNAPQWIQLRETILQERKWSFLAAFALIGAFRILLWRFPHRLDSARDTLLRPRWQSWMALVVLLVAIVNVFATPFFRHWVFFCQVLLLAGFFVPELAGLWARVQQASYYGKVAAGFLAFGFCVKLIPVAFVPPFYGGISGWTKKHPPTDKVTITMIQMVRDDNETVWWSPELGSPQHFHFLQYVRNEHDDDRLRQVMIYYLRLYECNYPFLLEGRYRFQALLGDAAYPTHLPAKMLSYGPFPPERIVAIRYAAEIYNRSTRRMEQRIVFWSVDARTGYLDRTPTTTKFE